MCTRRKEIILRYKPADKLLKTYLEFEFGKHAARVWIRYPKPVLFKLLAAFHDKEEFEQIKDAVRNKSK